jgi:hypothetical protein
MVRRTEEEKNQTRRELLSLMKWYLPSPTAKLVGPHRFEEGLCNFIAMLHSINMTFQMCSGGMHFLFCIWSGVLQGCPLSATLFLMCIDPFLNNFEFELKPNKGGIVCACADDIGAALSNYTFLKSLFRIFQTAREISNMQLKPGKCNIIPTNLSLTSELTEWLRHWLTENIPEWREFQIVSGAKYLGFLMGPSIKDTQWTSAINKWSGRVKAIAASRCGPSTAAFLYNYTALPVLGYRAQLLHTPDAMHIKERHALHHLFHMPPNSLDLTHFHQLALAGASAIKPVSCSCQAALYRAAQVTVSGWRIQLDCLDRTFRELMPFAHWSSNVLAPPCWDSPPFVSNLAAALAGSSFQSLFLAPSRALPALLSSWKSPASAGPAARLPVQQIALRAFTSHIVKNTWIDLICRRIKTLDPKGAFSPASNCVDNIHECLKKCSKFVAMSWVKTISNAWTTTYRMHERQLWSCVFGCAECEDSTSHYLSCPLLLSLVHEISSTPFGPSVAHRLGLIDPDLSHIHLLTICFSVYHTLKGEYKHKIIEAFRHQRFAEVHHLARKIAHDSFHSYRLIFQNQTPITQFPPSLASRFSELRSDPSLVEAAPGVFSRGIFPLRQ